MGLGIAMGAFLKCLFNQEFGQKVKSLALGEATISDKAPNVNLETAKTQEEKTQKSEDKKSYQHGAVQLLAEFQKEGRLIDFLEEDLDQYQDEEIGSSVRSIHEGCKKVLDHNFDKEKIIDQEEESSYRIDQGYNSHHIKLSGRVRDSFPLKGTLVHPGWKINQIQLKERPKAIRDILTPAEVEIE